MNTVQQFHDSVPIPTVDSEGVAHHSDTLANLLGMDSTAYTEECMRYLYYAGNYQRTGSDTVVVEEDFDTPHGTVRLIGVSYPNGTMMITGVIPERIG